MADETTDPTPEETPAAADPATGPGSTPDPEAPTPDAPGGDERDVAAEQADVGSRPDPEAPAADAEAGDADPGTATDAADSGTTGDAEGEDAEEPAAAPRSSGRARQAATPSRRAAPRTRGAAAPRAATAPRPTRRRREPVDADVRVRALAKYVRTSPRKARLVADLVRGKDVEQARAVLAHSTRDAAQDWSKVLESAVANAENNLELDGADLRIADIRADEGPTIKRFRPRAQGRAFQIKKRTSHLSVQLQPKES